MDNGGPAFPTPYKNPEWPQGMSLRDAASLMVLGGLLLFIDRGSITPEEAARDAWRYADAWLAAREEADDVAIDGPVVV